MSANVTYHSVAKTSDLNKGEAKQVVIGKKEIAIYNLDGKFYATDDICTHAYASLADGYIEGDKIECPLHGGAFVISTGKACAPPCTEDLKVYPVKIENGQIMVGVPSD